MSDAGAIETAGARKGREKRTQHIGNALCENLLVQIQSGGNGSLQIAGNDQRLRQSEYGYGDSLRHNLLDEQPMLRPHVQHIQWKDMQADMAQQLQLRRDRTEPTVH